MDRHIPQLLQEGATSISNLLLKRYKRMSLTDEEMMLMIHLLSFQQEGNTFPTLHQLEERLSMSSLRLIQLLQKLIKEGWLTIDESVDRFTGVRSESYNLSPLYERLYQCWKKDHLVTMEGYGDTARQAAAFVPYDEQPITAGIYNQFEQAFGRPLSPFEIETLQTWLDQDRYPEELIITALREASSVGKLYIRYIDRILLEWQRHDIQTVEDARNFSLRFRKQAMARDS